MNIDKLNEIKQLSQSLSTSRLSGSVGVCELLVCTGTGCASGRSDLLVKKLNDLLLSYKLENVRVIKTGCFGFCKKGPIIVTYPDLTFYCEVTEEGLDEIVKSHIIEGKKAERFLYREPGAEKMIESIIDIPFFHSQLRHALKNCGVIDPENIDEYITMDGYFALHKALTEMTPDGVIEEVKNSGLRGRGGAGFPTGLKWETAAAVESDEKYIICNADEGDPGAFMDRSILEGDPHSVVEAMAIAAYAIGAKHGYIYVRTEYPIAVKRFEIAVNQARYYNLLGDNIFGTDFCFDITIRLGAGAFVCGEETALIKSASGKRGEPRSRPPYPAEAGIWEKPTVVNNVETLVNVPQIILRGADEFKKLGTPKSSGTKVFALAGRINNTGLIEVPMGTTLRTIIYDIGGGIPDGKEFKAVQTGGPSGGCIPKEYLDTPIDYESLAEIGSMMGSGGMIVMDESTCMVDIAKFYLEFSQDESCGKCSPCRVGTQRMLEMLTKIIEGEPIGNLSPQQVIDELLSLSEDIKDASLCGLGQTAPNPVMSAIKYFKDEFLEHIDKKQCRAGVCKKLAKYKIVDEKCIACGICAKICPVSAIDGVIKKPPYQISAEICIACGACEPKCPTKAIFH